MLGQATKAKELATGSMYVLRFINIKHNLMCIYLAFFIARVMNKAHISLQSIFYFTTFFQWKSNSYIEQNIYLFK